jgi:plastocyanin
VRHRIGWRSAFATSVVSVSVGLACWTASAASETTLEAPVVTVTAGKPSEFAFTVSKSSGLPGLVTFKVTNRGTLAHAFAVAGAATKVLRPGQSALLTVTFDKAGTYEYRSSVQGQAAKGMKGRLVVVSTIPAAKPAKPAKPASSSAPAPAVLPLAGLAPATPAPVEPPVLEAAPAMAAEPEPPPKVNQCGECHYD